ncbi:hypothetical protein ACNSOO_06830 [Aliarcobacter lanthieri]|uniref:hypothetical protein n=1 Tax=Aliarcobacter lanthieri TaxID=1355374 RepID=UPI003AAFDCB7
MNKNETFFKCEFKFLSNLILGLLLLNFVAILLQYLFNIGLFISIILSMIVLVIYVIYFLYLVIKVKVFDVKYECQDLKQRLSGWLSSLI